MVWSVFFDARLRRADEPGFERSSDSSVLARAVLSALTRPTGDVGAWVACLSVPRGLGRSLELVERSIATIGFAGAWDTYLLGADEFLKASESAQVRRWIAGLATRDPRSEVVQEVCAALPFLPLLTLLRECPERLSDLAMVTPPFMSVRAIVQPVKVGLGAGDGLCGVGGTVIDTLGRDKELRDAFAPVVRMNVEDLGGICGSWESVAAWLGVYETAATPTSLRTLSSLLFRWGCMATETSASAVEALSVCCALDPSHQAAKQHLDTWLDPARPVASRWTTLDRHSAYEAYTSFVQTNSDAVQARRDEIVARVLVQEIGGETQQWEWLTHGWFETLNAPNAEREQWLDVIGTNSPLASRFEARGWPCIEPPPPVTFDVGRVAGTQTISLRWATEIASLRNPVPKAIVAACVVALACVFALDVWAQRLAARRAQAYERFTATVSLGGAEAFAAATAYRDAYPVDHGATEDTWLSHATAVACELAW